MISATKILVRRAREDERDQIVDVLTEAADWLLTKGIRQWPSPFPPKYIDGDLTAGFTYLVFLDDELAGTITLKERDPIFWPDAPHDALYLHRVAVRRQHQGLGDFLISWAERRALAQGKEYLRLDCWKQNMSLRRYYEDRGFEYKGDIQGLNEGTPWECALYEKRIGE
jgi:ribosomal protein S18 acetylase RimI-like enzyme